MPRLGIICKKNPKNPFVLFHYTVRSTTYRQTDAELKRSSSDNGRILQDGTETLSSNDVFNILLYLLN